MNKLKKYILRKRYYRVEECLVMAKDREDAKDRAWSDINSSNSDYRLPSSMSTSSLHWEYLDDNLKIEAEECRGVFV